MQFEVTALPAGLGWLILTVVLGPTSAVWSGPTRGTVSPGPTGHWALDGLNRARRALVCDTPRLA
jgi:hypothetical protein